MADVTQDLPSSAASVDSTTSASASFGKVPIRLTDSTGTDTIRPRDNSWATPLAPEGVGIPGATSTDNLWPEPRPWVTKMLAGFTIKQIPPRCAGNHPQISHT